MSAHWRFQIFETIPWLLRYLSPFHQAGRKPNFILQDSEFEVPPDEPTTSGFTGPGVNPQHLPGVNGGRTDNIPLEETQMPASQIRVQPPSREATLGTNLRNNRQSLPLTSQYQPSPFKSDATDDEVVEPQHAQPRPLNRNRLSQSDGDGLLGDTLTQLMTMRSIIDDAVEGLATWQRYARYQRVASMEAVDEDPGSGRDPNLSND